MNIFNSLKELEDTLPNGFHDALLETVTLSLPERKANMELKLLVGDPDAKTKEEREAHKRAILRLEGVVYVVVDPPDPRYAFSYKDGLSIDAGDATDYTNPKAPRPCTPLPEDAFAHWFFVRDWNSFIHVAAATATLEWV